MAAAQPKRAFRVPPFDYREARALASELKLAEPVAVTLVRRGYRTVEAAREFLEAAEEHSPFAFESMEECVGILLNAVSDGRRITVHGDYDVDGVSSTAIVVGALRELEARCDWHIPERRSEGYGLTGETVDRLAGHTDVLVCVDCGITSKHEVEAARRAGMEVIVADHHKPPAELPPCPILHPSISGYPFADLCAAGVAHKLATALRQRAGITPAGEEDLDAVALATVADMVPLVGENRRLVRRGLEALRHGARLGLRALMAVSRTDPATLDEGDLGFRLAPRINAAGRLYRADAGVELLLTKDDGRAAEIAAELDRANSERRATEAQVITAAEAARAELTEAELAAPALVLAGEGWHPGVIGIAASRMVERHWRPVVLVALDGERGRGSGRSVPGFDLVEALGECGRHLERWGGHAAAAGLEIRAGAVEEFRRAFLRCATEQLADEDLVRSESVDALVGIGRDGIGLDLAEQLERLAPFGAGNPGPRLVVPAGRIRDVRPLGEEGRHSRFNVESGPRRAFGVAFNSNGELSRQNGDQLDLSVRLEIDRWNGSVQPRVVLNELYPFPTESADREPVSGCPVCSHESSLEQWWRRLDCELALPLGDWPPAEIRRLLAAHPGLRREPVDRRGGGAVAAIAELVASGDRVIVICADAARRRALGEKVADPRRFGGGPAALACQRCCEEDLDAALGGDSGLVVTDWGCVVRRPGALRSFEHVVIVDPAPFDHLLSLAELGRAAPGAVAAPFAAGFVHLCWGGPEIDLAWRLLDRDWPSVETLREACVTLEQVGEEADGELAQRLLAGSGPFPRSAEAAARILRVLVEAGRVACEGDAAERRLRVVSSKPIDPQASEAAQAYRVRHEEGKRFLKTAHPRP